eukprot:scaffold22807_cov98-Isochrysis_galbana.AAC.1
MVSTPTQAPYWHPERWYAVAAIRRIRPRRAPGVGLGPAALPATPAIFLAQRQPRSEWPRFLRRNPHVAPPGGSGQQAAGRRQQAGSVSTTVNVPIQGLRGGWRASSPPPSYSLCA